MGWDGKGREGRAGCIQTSSAVSQGTKDIVPLARASGCMDNQRELVNRGHCGDLTSPDLYEGRDK